MGQLYWGNKLTLCTTCSVLVLIGYVYWLWQNRGDLEHWGIKTIGLFGLGLFVCIMAAWRDHYHLSVEGLIQNTEQLGLFRTESLQSILNCIVGGLLFLLLLASFFMKNQEIKRTICFSMGGLIAFKLLFIEISRIIYLF